VIEKIFTVNKNLKSMRDTQWTLTVIIIVIILYIKTYYY